MLHLDWQWSEVKTLETYPTSFREFLLVSDGPVNLLGTQWSCHSPASRYHITHSTHPQSCCIYNTHGKPSYWSACLLSTVVILSYVPFTLAKTVGREGKKNYDSRSVYVRVPDRGVTKYRTKWLLSISSSHSMMVFKIPHSSLVRIVKLVLIFSGQQLSPLKYHHIGQSSALIKCVADNLPLIIKMLTFKNKLL